MDELNELMRPSWGAEKWILEGWQQITDSEKALIKSRVHELFKEGLPFELTHDKLLYLYVFSLLAQLEVLAIQIPLKFEERMSSDIQKERMHQQLIDEIFHGIVFTKIVYALASPQALPPAYNKEIEVLCDFIRNEDCPKIGLVLLNLIGEGWIEEIFTALQQQNVAPKVFSVILADEHRHVCEAELYQDIGLPDKKTLRAKLDYLEEQLVGNIFLQDKYVYSFFALLGAQGMENFITALNKKHEQQLQKINLQPGQKWLAFMSMYQDVMPEITRYSKISHEVEMSALRKALMTQWANPSDPTMAGEFNINVSCLGLFDKTYPSETLTTLMLQTISKVLTTEDSFRNYLSHNKLFQSKEAYTAVIVKLPECGDHIGSIIFENCHEKSVLEIAARIRQILKMMVYCYKKCEALEKQFPHLKTLFASMFHDFMYADYPYPVPGSPVVSLSNIGFCGYTQAKSPLRVNEGLKFTLFEVQRKPVWDKQSQSFKPQDILPVSVSADHRIFDGNLPIPKIITRTFHDMFAQMDLSQKPSIEPMDESEIIQVIDGVIKNNVELAYKSLRQLHTIWADFINLDDLFNADVVNQPEMLKKSTQACTQT